MKTTIELPDDLFREAKATAAKRGEPLKNFVREALEEKIHREASRVLPGQWPVPPMPMPAEERDAFDQFIEEAFEQIDDEDWA